MSEWRSLNRRRREGRRGGRVVSAQVQLLASAGSLTEGLPTRRRSIAGLIAAAGTLLAGCSSNSQYLSPTPPAQSPQAPQGATIGAGEVKAALVLPLSAPGNAGLAGQAMRNAAEMALAEFSAPNVTLLVKDDAGNTDAARAGAQQALEEGAEIILGPLFAQSVSAVGQVARPRNIPMIAFSTDANVASSGVYLLSFLPESDVQRIVQYASSTGKRSYAALMPDNPYGTVVEAAFRQDVARRGGQIVVLEHYAHDKASMAGPIRTVAQAAVRADALFIPDGGDAAPDGAGFRSFSARYRSRYNADPARTATLAYDAVALVAALVKTQSDPQQRFSQTILTNPSGFTGIDGLFR